ncbi:4182_t:CDS:2 [Funneliformis geosporum]|nr:4182_t:CDS:2 [Funneliformis geosporum]
MPSTVINQETSQINNDNNPKIEENYIYEESNRTRIVALAVREACYVANYGHKQHDWDSACQLILHNKLLTFSEKSMIITLFQCKQCK